mmetsp:Transcript_13942/g.30478  ORF Transcript_13942/g.30478 Transcript_13942/m.30478 type:complete len:200 (-) Transcript_13942:1015-1614(-)
MSFSLSTKRGCLFPRGSAAAAAIKEEESSEIMEMSESETSALEAGRHMVVSLGHPSLSVFCQKYPRLESILFNSAKSLISLGPQDGRNVFRTLFGCFLLSSLMGRGYLRIQNPCTNPKGFSVVSFGLLLRRKTPLHRSNPGITFRCRPHCTTRSRSKSNWINDPGVKVISSVPVVLRVVRGVRCNMYLYKSCPVSDFCG